jgi:hypothetical protein
MKDLALLSLLYRAAVITKASGHTRFFTVKFENDAMTYQFTPAISGHSQQVYATIVLHDNQASPPPCEEKAKLASNCRDLSADEVISRIGPIIGQNAATLESEIAEIKAANREKR